MPKSTARSMVSFPPPGDRMKRSHLEEEEDLDKEEGCAKIQRRSTSLLGDDPQLLPYSQNKIVPHSKGNPVRKYHSSQYEVAQTNEYGTSLTSRLVTKAVLP